MKWSFVINTLIEFFFVRWKLKHVTDNNVDFIKLDKNATNESAREIVNLKHVTMFFFKIYVLSDQRHWKIYAYFKSRLFFFAFYLRVTN